MTAVISLVTSFYLMPFIPNLLEGADKLYLEATMSKKIIESMYPVTIRERLLKRRSDGGISRESRSGSVEEYFGENQSKQDENSATPRRKPTLFNRMSRSDSMTIRRIHEFLNRKKVGNVDEIVVSPGRDSSDPAIADLFPSTSIMFADISNFTYWSSNHSPCEVFDLLETLFFEFDLIATEMDVFKLSTVGDCYIASTGVPDQRDDHAILLAKFAERCRRTANDVLQKLSKQEGMHDVTALSIRIGIHSGPVTAGVLRGRKARFDLFGDTINTAARIESTGLPNKVHLSRETAELLEMAGKSEWLAPREKSVSAKGKGELKTFWLQIPDEEDDSLSDENSNGLQQQIFQFNGIELPEKKTPASRIGSGLVAVLTIAEEWKDEGNPPENELKRSPSEVV